ncbi:MAG: hypothetical protein M1823_002847 [Watsoniomyces obsoletus]|nr:MAG: hypothetical protein M1823_002847 [Watsoniomyces obsoletus]
MGFLGNAREARAGIALSTRPDWTPRRADALRLAAGVSSTVRLVAVLAWGSARANGLPAAPAIKGYHPRLPEHGNDDDNDYRDASGQKQWQQRVAASPGEMVRQVVKSTGTHRGILWILVENAQHLSPEPYGRP